MLYNYTRRLYGYVAETVCYSFVVRMESHDTMLSLTTGQCFSTVDANAVGTSPSYITDDGEYSRSTEG